MSLIVFGTSVSPFVRKVRIVLTEKGLLYRHENVNEAKPPDGWRELSPLGKIPAFKDCDRALAGSSVICAYLERRFPMPPLYPSEPYDYARALWFEDYMDDGFAPLGRSPRCSCRLSWSRYWPASRRPMSPPRRLRAKRSTRNSPHSGTISSASSATASFLSASASLSPILRSRTPM
jgi:glutathione S-transferase